MQLSGGQKQRIAIARVALRDPMVVLLDEATSVLDTGLERDVMNGVLGRLVMDGRRTCVMEAHRLATAASADKIPVVQDSVIAEEGHSGGVYTSLAAACRC